MTAHLTLVVDNAPDNAAGHAAGQVARHQTQGTIAARSTLLTANSSQHPTAFAATTREKRRAYDEASPEDQHWVHRVWQPRHARELTRFSPLRRLRAQLSDDRGAITAEYAVVIIAGIAFAGLLVAIIRSDEIRQTLVNLVQNALGSAV